MFELEQKSDREQESYKTKIFNISFTFFLFIVMSFYVSEKVWEQHRFQMSSLLYVLHSCVGAFLLPHPAAQYPVLALS
jgi:hypothetical protein